MRAHAQPEQIILVDNGSTDDSIAAINSRYENRIHVIANDRNLGFTGGSNQGCRRALELGAEWVLLLNNDTEAAADFFDEIERVLKLGENLSYQILSPVIFHYSKPKIIWHLGARRIPGTLLARNLNKNKPLPEGLSTVLPVDFISGCAMLVHHNVIRKIGLFDERFFAYWEEVDFCMRAKKAGFNIAVMTKPHLWHKVSLTASRNPTRKRYYYTRNMIFYTRKNAHGFEWPIMLGYLFFKLIITLIRDVIARRTELIQPLLQGWRDGWLSSIERKSQPIQE